MMKYVKPAALGVLACLFFALTCLYMSCDGEEDGTHGIGTGATVSLSCTESGPECTPPVQSQGSVNASSLRLCNYWASSGNFQVEFREGSTDNGILVQIADFVGDGTYQTTPDERTNVTVVTTYEGDQVSGNASGDPPTIAEHPCTIVAETNLEDITIPEEGDDNLLDVHLDVTCPTLGSGAICEITCTVTPATFPLSVTGCLVSQ